MIAGLVDRRLVMEVSGRVNALVQGVEDVGTVHTDDGVAATTHEGAGS